MLDSLQLKYYVIAWLAAFLITLVTATRRKTVGIVFGFLIANSLVNDFSGSVVHLFEDNLLRSTTFTILGMRVATIGMVAFACSYLFLAPRITLAFRGSRSGDFPQSDEIGRKSREAQYLVPMFVAVGTLFYINTLQQLVSFPLSGTFANLLVLGVCLIIYREVERGHHIVAAIIAGAASLFFILSTVVAAGFLSFGTTRAITVLIFYFALRKISMRMLGISIAVAYVGLSLFVNYFSYRSAIRTVVWGEESKLSASWAVVQEMLEEWQWFSLGNSAQLASMDQRLNRNFLVGVAVHNVESGRVELARGQTIFNVLVAPIPRALWPNKPSIAGGSEVVSKYTLYTFSSNTAVGMGPLFESYVNFGSVGVLTIFSMLAIIVSFVDQRARNALESGNITSFCYWFFPATVLVNPSDSIAAAFGGALRSYAVVYLTIMIAKLYLSHSRKTTRGFPRNVKHDKVLVHQYLPRTDGNW